MTFGWFGLVALGWLASAAVLVCAGRSVGAMGRGTDDFDDVMLRGVVAVFAPILIVFVVVLAAVWLVGAGLGWAVERLGRR